MAPTLDLLERALDQTGGVIARVRPEQATLPTPCTDWDVRTLVNHTVYDLKLFKSMVDGAERPAPDDNPVGQDWGAAYNAAASSLREAWQRRGEEGTMHLGRLGEMPASWAIGQHMADIAVHGWDIARATGQPTEADPQVGEASLEWARQSLKPELRGQTFGPEVKVPDDTPLYERLAAFFGRTP
ncbi:MAG TPA: TIGR03086 family metal-binding protein [Chloroflexota bacterium]|jgi:uncharacterized protein (TIGR03086 family)|nr:TIGR03086 family metal-binding protein [Chloroflexota bacterium]